MPATQTTPAALLLESRGVRATGARLEVLNALLSSPQALSHLDLHARLPQLDRVTLYRALDCLCNAAIAHKIPAEDRIFRYSAQAPADDSHSGEHGHFQCTCCTRIFCLSDAVYSPALRELLQASLQASLGRGFFSDQLELNIKGRCPDCSK